MVNIKNTHHWGPFSMCFSYSLTNFTLDNVKSIVPQKLLQITGGYFLCETKLSKFGKNAVNSKFSQKLFLIVSLEPK